MKILASWFMAGVLFFVGTVAFAGSIASIPPIVTPGGPNSQTTTRAYAGLNWTLGGSYTPAVVLGVTNVKVKSNGDTTGANLAFHLNLAGGTKPGMLKLSYLNGNDSLQGELGLGFNFLTGAPLLFLGARGPYIAAGVDAYMATGFIPYLQLHTMDSYSKPAGGASSVSCAAGYVYNAGTSMCDPFVPAPPV